MFVIIFLLTSWVILSLPLNAAEHCTPDNDPCPDVKFQDGDHSPATIEVSATCKLEVEYEVRMCNGNVQYRIISIEPVQWPPDNNCEHFDYTRMVDLGLVFRANNDQKTNQGIVPACDDENPQKIEKYTTSNCSFTLVCDFPVDVNHDEIECDCGVTFDEPPSDGFKHRETSTFSCGKACCIDVFYICDQTPNELGGSIIEDYNYGDEVVSECDDLPNGSNCSPQIDPEDCSSCN